jgi:hypothetical protein
MSRKFRVSLNPKKINGALQENRLKWMIIYSRTILRKVNFPVKGYIKNQNTLFMFNDLFFESLSLWDNMEENMVQLDRPQVTTVEYGHKRCYLYAE